VSYNSFVPYPPINGRIIVGKNLGKRCGPTARADDCKMHLLMVFGEEVSCEWSMVS
jgi:hypothetical protein